MKAEIGKTYALVQDGKAHQIFTIAELPEWHDGLEVIDVTGLSVSGGDSYGNGGFYKPPLPSLPEVAATKLAKLTAAYQTAIQQPVTYMGTTFQADDASRASITEAVAPDPLPDGYEWLDANNVFVPMTSAQLQSLAAVMRKQVQVAFVKLQERKAAVRAATTVAQIGAVVW